MGRRKRTHDDSLPRRYTRWREALDGPCKKRPYDTKRECLEAIKITLQNTRELLPPGSLRPYKCQHCKKWHMTSQDPRRPPWESRQSSRR